MENIAYHPSLYTITVPDNDSLIIYNSLNGKKNNIVNPTLINKIKTMLNQTIIYDDGTTAFRYLVENRFIVPLNTDERKLAELVRFDHVMNRNLRLVIMPTEQCNFRCQYCYESFKHGKMSLEHQNGIIEYIRRNINRFTSVHLEWYGGEPLLAFDIIQYISNAVLNICRCAKKPMTSSITTNGYYLTLDVFKELQRYHVINIQITIDGLKSTHDKQRVLANGDPTYDIILHNLVEIKNKTKSATSRIVLRTNVTRDIFEKFDEYIDYYDGLFGDDIRFSYLIRPVGDWVS